MKAKSLRVRHILLVVLCLVTAGVVVLCRNVRKSDTPVRLDRVVDEETITFVDGRTVKLLGIDVSGGGKINGDLIRQYLSALLKDKNIWLEGDSSINNTDGIDLAWVWVGCEKVPKFWAVRGVGENPVNCQKGVLVNEQLIKMGWSKVYFPAEVGEMKYEKRLYETQQGRI